DVTRLELPHPGLTLRPRRDVARGRTTIVHPEAQPAGRAPSMQVAVGRVEIQITVERPLGGPGAEPERRGRREQLIQAFGARHAPAQLGHRPWAVTSPCRSGGIRDVW